MQKSSPPFRPIGDVPSTFPLRGRASIPNLGLRHHLSSALQNLRAAAVSTSTSSLSPGKVVQSLRPSHPTSEKSNAKGRVHATRVRPSGPRGCPPRVRPGQFVAFARSKLGIGRLQVDSVPVQAVLKKENVPASSSEVKDFIPVGFSSSMPDAALVIASNSLQSSTKKNYKNIFRRFVHYGESLGTDVLKFDFSAIFLVSFFLSLYTNKGSIGSLLMARAAINFYWILHCNSSSCPTDSPFVSKFFKGLTTDKKLLKPVQKAYPVNYDELQQLFFSISGGISFPLLSFIKQRFIALLILAFSSFARFEETQFLKVANIVMVDSDFSIQFEKGKSYRESRYGVIPSFPFKDFDPAHIFGIYLDRVALLHSEGNCSNDFLFPNIRAVRNKVFPLNTPVSYSNTLKTLKREASLAHLPFSSFKLGLHSLRRGPVTHSVNSGADPFIVKKLMRVKTLSMVDHYSEADHQLLLKASKSAF